MLTIRFKSLVLCFRMFGGAHLLAGGCPLSVLLYRREQNKRWAEMGALLDIIDEATIVLREQNRKGI